MAPKFSEYFSVNPEQAVDEALKSGIFRTFDDYVKSQKFQTEHVRVSTVNVLDLLARVDTKRKKRVKQPNLGAKNYPSADFAFFSRRNRCLVKFYIGENGGKMIHDGIAVDQLSKNLAPPSAKETANFLFRKMLKKQIDKFATDEVAMTLLKGVCHTLLLAESFAGLSLDVFKEHQVLFEKLRQVYEHTELALLDSEKGCYNPALAV